MLLNKFKDQIPIELYEGNEMKEKIGAISYIEISSKENINVNEVLSFHANIFIIIADRLKIPKQNV